MNNVNDLPECENWQSKVGALNDTQMQKPFEMLKEFDEEEYVQIRVLSAQKFAVSPDSYFKKPSEFDLKLKKLRTSISSKNKKRLLEIDTLIIHIHGGGFIATSSFSHLGYLMQWANQIPNAAIFSIDYRLAPKNKFPDQIDDCW